VEADQRVTAADDGADLMRAGESLAADERKTPVEGVGAYGSAEPRQVDCVALVMAEPAIVSAAEPAPSNFLPNSPMFRSVGFWPTAESALRRHEPSRAVQSVVARPWLVLRRIQGAVELEALFQQLHQEDPGLHGGAQLLQEGAGRFPLAGLGKSEVEAKQVPGGAKQGPAMVGIRPETLAIQFEGENTDRRLVDAMVDEVVYYGDMTYYDLRTEGSEEPLTISMKNLFGRPVLEVGVQTKVVWDERSLVVFPV